MARKREISRSADPGVATVAALIGEPARAAMLCALLDGGERPAGELALLGAVAPNAASAHLAKLVAGGLIVARTEGRQRLFRLAGPNVARAVEALLAIAPPPKIVALSQSRVAGDLRAARSCYDHLAGQLGVAVTEALVATRSARSGRAGLSPNRTRRGVFHVAGRRPGGAARHAPAFCASMSGLERAAPASRRRARFRSALRLSASQLGCAKTRRPRAARYARGPRMVERDAFDRPDAVALAPLRDDEDFSHARWPAFAGDSFPRLPE